MIILWKSEQLFEKLHTFEFVVEEAKNFYFFFYSAADENFFNFGKSLSQVFHYHARQKVLRILEGQRHQFSFTAPQAKISRILEGQGAKFLQCIAW